jgi:hypothetical protein
MTDATKQFNVRLPAISQEQVKELEAKTGLTQTQLIIMALDRLHNNECRKEQEGRN